MIFLILTSTLPNNLRYAHDHSQYPVCTQPSCFCMFMSTDNILQWPASVPGNIPNHAQLISRDNQVVQLGDSQYSTLSSPKLQ